MNDIFPTNITQMIDWKWAGHAGLTGSQSTFWMGTLGAHTPCHFDTYGYNLIVQITGKKLWVMFPPDDTVNLYPTRVPYEESSVFSRVNPFNPDLLKYPKFKNTKPHVCIMHAGQFLFVPKHWWHFVLCISPAPEPAISINCWIELESDKMERLKEAKTRIIVNSIMSQIDPSGTSWVNTQKEIDEITNHYQNIQLYRRARKCLDEPHNNDPVHDYEDTFNAFLSTKKCVNVKTFDDFDDYLNFITSVKKDYFGFTVLPHEEKCCDEYTLNLNTPPKDPKTDDDIFEQIVDVLNHIIFDDFSIINE